MGGDRVLIWLATCLLLSLRTMPVLMFAPPFNMARVPRLIAAMIGLVLAMLLEDLCPEQTRLASFDAGAVAIGGLRELFVGLVPVVALQLAFAALNIAGRTIDMQAGYGLAMMIDPTTRGQVPLIGTLFGFVAAISFFAVQGPLELLRFLVASLHTIPLGAPHHWGSLAALGALASGTALIALGVAGVALAALLMCDIVIAMLSRTVPQMNALLIGVQVKSAVMLATVPIALGLSGGLFLRLIALALQAMPGLI
ncbi:MAG: flagellar biosynthetic protein FliR [Proteobacteria bacterium]|nr:flagellar biosynthetic protein FliR [Pseudomonadota bacterium]